MSAMTSQITSLTIVYSTVCTGADQRKHQSSSSLAFVGGIHLWPVNSPHKWNAENVSIWWRHHANVSMVSEWLKVYSTPQHQSASGPVHFRHGSGMFSWPNVDTVIDTKISAWCILILTFNKRPVPGIRHPDSRIWHPVCHRKGRLMDEYIRFKSDHT